MTVCCPSRRPPAFASSGIWQECSCALFGGLLCSSCCVVQLFLNVFSIGCAGFSALTPYRPLFLATTVTALVGNYWKYKNTRRTALAVAVAFGLAITPEIVQLYNRNQLPSFPDLLKASGYSKARQKLNHGSLLLSVSGLKCQACCARLKQHILDVDSVEKCDVNFERAEVHVQGSDLQEEDVISSIRKLGYDVSLISRHGKAEVSPEGRREALHFQDKDML